MNQAEVDPTRKPLSMSPPAVLFQQRLHFVKEFLVAARSRTEECRADFRIAFQCRMVEPFDFSPAIGPHRLDGL